MGAQLQTFPYPSSSRVKIVSLLQRLHGEIVHPNFILEKPVLHKRDLTRAKSEAYQTWHGNRGPRASSCISKAFLDLTHSDTL